MPPHASHTLHTHAPHCFCPHVYRVPGLRCPFPDDASHIYYCVIPTVARTTHPQRYRLRFAPRWLPPPALHTLPRCLRFVTTTPTHHAYDYPVGSWTYPSGLTFKFIAVCNLRTDATDIVLPATPYRPYICSVGSRGYAHFGYVRHVTPLLRCHTYIRCCVWLIAQCNAIPAG